jgi:hypothetical protein
MQTIYKVSLKTTDEQFVQIARGAKLLTVQMQHGGPQLWFECDTNAVMGSRRIAIYGTGHQMLPQPQKYVGTYQLDNGALVFHVYDLGEA